jgi:hypothetical protein
MPRFNPADQAAITVTDPVLASTEISGQVVDENGDPLLAGMPVSIGGATAAVTNASGDFTLTGVTANPARSARAGRSGQRKAGWP